MDQSYRVRIKPGQNIIHDMSIFCWPDCKISRVENSSESERIAMIFYAHKEESAGKVSWICKRRYYGEERHYGNGPIIVTDVDGVVIVDDMVPDPYNHIITDRLPRYKEELGSGSGHLVWQGQIFEMHHWYRGIHKITQVEFKNMSSLEPMIFEGHLNFGSDAECFYQMTFTEFREYIEEIKKEYISIGRVEKIKEIREIFME